MKIIEMLWDAIRRDPQKPPKPTVDEYCSTENERLNLEAECAVYKRELLRLGYRPELLKAMATANLTEVRAS